MSESFDVFNGDADGILSLHQLRLSDPKASKKITGIKRDIALLKKVADIKDAEVCVLDISLERNQDALATSLKNGQKIIWFDHHRAGDVPNHANLQTHIDLSPDVCTGILVNQYLKGQHELWAIAAAFGDNLHKVAEAMGRHLSSEILESLKQLGEVINYNAYGESLDDLCFHPEAVSDDLQNYVTPSDYINKSDVYHQILEQKEKDLQAMKMTELMYESQQGKVMLLPDSVSSRRMSGIYSNQLVYDEPNCAHAILTKMEGGYRVSIRSPLSRPEGADRLAKAFAGGGRAKAAGIDLLKQGDLENFYNQLDEVFSC